MKFTAVILTVAILFLAFKPGVDLIALPFSAQHSCCTESCEASPMAGNAESDQNKDDCNGYSCNPFQSCGTSFLPVLASLESNLQNIEISTQRNFSYQSNYSSSFTTDFWQPPRLA